MENGKIKTNINIEARKKKFTYEQHIDNGKKISEITNYLRNLSCHVSNTYGKSSKNTKIAIKTLQNAEMLRHLLDDQFYNDYPGLACSFDSYFYDPETIKAKKSE